MCRGVARSQICPGRSSDHPSITISVSVGSGTSAAERDSGDAGRRGWRVAARCGAAAAGTSIGGDCDELRIQSTGSTDFHEVRGHGGSLYFEDTVVTSWDTPNKRPQEEYEGGRSFINCVSEYESSETCDGQPKNDYGECRMDIIDSEMGYLGWFDSESYGLTWKVRGFCADKSNPEVFDTTNVYGDIKNSDIHHMYYGMYSYGHQVMCGVTVFRLGV